MKIAITLNDTIRNFYQNFEAIYLDYLEEEENFVPSESELMDDEILEEEYLVDNKDDLKLLYLDGRIDPQKLTHKFKFKNKEDYFELLYSKLAFEIFAKTDVTYKGVDRDFLELNSFFNNNRSTLDLISIEVANSKPSTLFWLSREKIQISCLNFLESYKNIWKTYDLIITADPFLLEYKPKKTIKILSENNKDIKHHLEFNRLTELITYLKNNGQ